MSEKVKNVRYALLGMLLFFAAAVQAQTISGNVKDSTGEGVIGATVQEVGTQNATVTDFDGNFTLKLQDKKHKVQVSYVGMQPKTFVPGDKTSFNLVLEDDNTALEELVVVGYGTVRKKDLTGAVANVNSKQLKDIPVTSASEALTGKMAGVNITTTEGSPDADVKIRVRGGGSLSQDNSPLYIVDGFEVESISDIAPSEIEQIDVLKDASSTAIYGARGANGVIIVTTKGGREGKVQIDLGASWGWKKATSYNKVLSPYDYTYYQYELYSGSQSKGFVSPYGTYDDIGIYKSIDGHDWQDEIFGRTGNQQMYNLNIAGGSKELQYSISYAHNSENSIMKGSGYSKDNINAKIKSKLSNWLTLDFNARLANSKMDGLSGGADTNESSAANSIVANASRYRPVDPLNQTTEDEDMENTGNIRKTPFERINATDKVKRTFNQTYNAKLTWKPWKKWTFATQFQYSWKNTDTDQVWLSDAVTNSKYGNNGRPQAELIRVTAKSWTNSNTVTYDDKKFFHGRDALNIMIGQETKNTRTTTLDDVVVAFPEDFNDFNQVKSHLGSGTPFANTQTIAADDNMLSFFGRINYTMMDKYLATFTMRADGSSKFASGNRWGAFPSVALAWRMSDEMWMKDKKWLSNLKLRLSFGTAGNNRIPSGLLYPTYSMSSATSKSPYFGDVRANQMELQSTMANPDLKWETTITRNFGIDFGFWKNRLSGSIDFYWNTTKDLLMKTKIPTSTGYAYQYQNFGKTSNKGIELQFNAVIFDKKDFSLNFTGNLAWNNNKIDELRSDSEWQSSSWGGISEYDDYRVVEGGRLGEIWGYKTNGYYTCWTPENKSGDIRYDGSKWVPVVNKETGETGVAGADGTDKSYTIFGGSLYPGTPKVETDENGDPLKQKLGNTVPTVTGGFGFNGTWKNFDFNVFFNYSLGNKIINGNKLALSYYTGSQKEYSLNEDFAVSNRYTWMDPETGMNLGRPSSSTVSAYTNADGLGNRLNELNAGRSMWNPAGATAMRLLDYAVEKASFLRLQQLTVGYTFPKAWLKKFYCNNARLYFTAYNVFCWTPYSGNDPEVDTSSKKNAMCPGVDYASYPKSRTFIFGVNLSF
jgi:TonB-linked SusC/RagA family outer membrane protein